MPGFAISLISIVILLCFVDLIEFWQAVQDAQHSLLIAGVIMTVLWLIIRSMAWRIILQDQIPFVTIFFTINEGYLLNNFLPFRLGEVGRAFLLAKKGAISFWQVLSSIVIERSFDLAIACSLLLVTVPYVVGASWANQAALITGVVVIFLFIGLFLFANRGDRLAIVISQYFNHDTFLYEWFDRAYRGLHSGLGVLKDSRQFMRAISCMMINWLVGIVQYYIFLRAFLVEAPIIWACFGLGVVALGVAAPSSPGAIGVLELLIVGALSVFQVNPATALAYAVTIHISQYLITGIIGSYALGKDGETLAGLYTKVKKLRSNRGTS